MKTLIHSLKNLFDPKNEFFQIAKTGKRITHIAIAIPLVIILLVSASIIAYFPGQSLVDYFNLGDSFISFYNLFVPFGLAILLMWLWVKFFEKRSFKTLGFKSKNAFKQYLSGFFIALIMLSAVIVLMKLFGTIHVKENPEPFSFKFLGVLVLLLIGYIVQGAAEEILARGWQFQVIAARYKPWLGALLSTVIFALLHGFNAGVSIMALINLMLFAFLLILFILHNKSIWAACGWHTAWNWAMENVFGLQVSGNVGGDSIFDLTSSGPTILTGGDFGPEASIFTTIVLLAGMIYILVLSKNKSK